MTGWPIFVPVCATTFKPLALNARHTRTVPCLRPKMVSRVQPQPLKEFITLTKTSARRMPCLIKLALEKLVIRMLGKLLLFSFFSSSLVSVIVFTRCRVTAKNLVRGDSFLPPLFLHSEQPQEDVNIYMHLRLHSRTRQRNYFKRTH